MSRDTRNTHLQVQHRYSARELEVFASVHRAHVKAQSITRLGRYVCAVLMVAALGWTVVHSLEAVAGKITIADLNATFTMSVQEKHASILAKAIKYAHLIYDGLATIFGAIGIWYARRCRKREDDTVIQFAPFRQMHESSIDAMRTSSGLERDGRTPPEERT